MWLHELHQLSLIKSRMSEMSAVSAAEKQKPRIENSLARFSRLFRMLPKRGTTNSPEKEMVLINPWCNSRGKSVLSKRSGCESGN